MIDGFAARLPQGEIRALAAKKKADRRLSSIDIEVDGGVNAKTAGSVVAAGADILVAGSFVFHHEDYREAIESLRRTDGV